MLYLQEKLLGYVPPQKNVTHNKEKNCPMQITPTFHRVDVWQKNHADVWQKPTQFSKAFILQLKNKLKKNPPQSGED